MYVVTVCVAYVWCIWFVIGPNLIAPATRPQDGAKKQTLKLDAKLAAHTANN